MSSLAAVQADGYYFPPEYEEKHGSLSRYNTTGQVGRKHAQKEKRQVVRFEMPFHAWCTGCGSMLAKGIRFNATKRRTGEYHSSPIYSFTMRTACCSGELVMVVQPQAGDFVIERGARKSKHHATTHDETETSPSDGEDGRGEACAKRQKGHATTTVLNDDNARGRGATPYSREHAREQLDPIAMLERERDDKARALLQHERIETLRRHSESTTKDDYSANSALRRAMRSRRKEHEANVRRAKDLNLPSHLKLRSSTADDARTAAGALASGRTVAAHHTRRDERSRLRTESIFSGGGRKSSDGGLRSDLTRKAVHKTASATVGKRKR